MKFLAVVEVDEDDEQMAAEALRSFLHAASIHQDRYDLDSIEPASADEIEEATGELIHEGIGTSSLFTL